MFEFDQIDEIEIIDVEYFDYELVDRMSSLAVHRY